MLIPYPTSTYFIVKVEKNYDKIKLQIILEREKDKLRNIFSLVLKLM